MNKDETPEDKFKRIAEIRTNNVLNSLRVLGNLSNRQVYGYSEKDVNKIFTAIIKQLKEIKVKFSTQTQAKFKL
ncbi:MAG: hypothetical protein PHG35_07630 [Dehalococcoidales bacterium]|nr:hypothetical protein [Dehalococcoidales bacterium]